MKYLDILPLSYIDYLTYSLPEEIKTKLIPGQEILVPFGKKNITGIFIKYSDKPKFKTKPIIKITNKHILTKNQAEMVDHLSSYYFASPIKAFKLMHATESEKITLSSINKTKNNKYILLEKDPTASYREILSKNLPKNNQILFVFSDTNSLNNFVSSQKNILKKYSSSIYHSQLKPKEKKEIIENVHRGKTRLVIGTRTALFLPFTNLGLIVVDKEGDDGHRSEETPRYDSQSIAEFICKQTGSTLILNAHIQSEELYIKSTTDYKIINKGVKNSLNSIIIDEPHYPIIGSILENKIKSDFNKNKKVAIFINNKGDNSILMCKDCKNILTCATCKNKLLTDNNKIYCRECNTQVNKIPSCNKCGGINIFAPGADIKKAIEELRNIFPKKIINEVSKNTKNNLDIRKTDIMVGTNYLKYVDFSNIETLIILYPENMTNLNGYNADSKALYLLLSLREKLTSGKNLYIKTSEEDNLIIKSLLSGEHLNFLKAKSEELKKYKYPPYVDILKIEISDKDTKNIFKSEKILKDFFKKYEIISEYEANYDALTKKVIIFKTMKDIILYDTILKSLKNITIERNPSQGI